MTEHKNVYMALSVAQAAMGPVVKGATNPHYKSKYADLADVMQVALPALNSNNIAAWHSVVVMDGANYMRTTLSHGESDTHIYCDVPLIVAKNDMQGMKSATTYAKRIGIESLTGIAPEDDDGQAAARAAPKPEPKPAARAAPKPEPKPAAPSAEAIAIASNSLSNADSLDQLKAIWMDLPNPIQAQGKVIDAKDNRKAALEAPQEEPQ